MIYPKPLLRGNFLRRYKRFFADILLDSGETVVSHTPNTGRMLTCLEPHARAYISQSDNPKRKLKYTWELMTSNAGLVGVNTLLANGLAQEAIETGVIPELQDYASLRREVKYGENSRIDLLLEGGSHPPCYVEVKSVTLGREGVASFPDAVSTRAQKHMEELAGQIRLGNRAVVLFVIQRMDCNIMTPANDIDPDYGKALCAAANAGVEVLAWQCDISPTAITLATPVPVKLITE